jgi:hypothetical protein
VRCFNVADAAERLLEGGEDEDDDDDEDDDEIGVLDSLERDVGGGAAVAFVRDSDVVSSGAFMNRAAAPFASR